MLKPNEKLTFLIPVHNEEKVVEQTIAEVKKELQKLDIDFEIVVVDDGSRDQSGQILKTIEGIRLITNPYNLGYGASLKRGIRNSLGDWIMIIDADGTYPISAIPTLLEKIGDFDMVVGQRSSQGDPFSRKPAKFILRKLASFLSGHKIPDLNSGMRVFRKSLALEFFHLFPSGFSFTSTITVASYANDYTVCYLPIDYYKRQGQSGIKPRHFFDFISLLVRLFLYFKPLKMIAPLASIIFVLGFSKLVRDYLVVTHVGTFAAILILISFQLFVMALIAEVLVRKNS